MNISEIVKKILTTQNAAFFYTPTIYGESKSYLLLKPAEIVKINSLRNLEEKLKRIDELLRKGFVGYSLMNYEAGYLFEKTLHQFLAGKENLIQVYFYDKKKMIEIDSNKIELSVDEKYKINNFKLNTAKKEYVDSIRKIKNYIAEGDTYQVNYTVKGKFNFKGSVAALFANLVFNQSARYIAIINNYSKLIISFSPELFFEIKGNDITSKPMKGTIRRGINYNDDKQRFEELKFSEKNKAENVMIVDMIRNDLGRFSEYGTMKVPILFDLEKYETVYQMVSTVKSKFNKNIKLSDVLKNIFPCGSITGAPKIRTMEIINELEKEKRGIYTGSIGLIQKNKITFNVPIRTLCIDKKSGGGEIGLGSGIVWNSKPDEEYSETRLKGKFLSNPVKSFEIIETMLVEDREVFLLDKHLNRMEETAKFFLFLFDRPKLESLVISILKNLDKRNYKLKISLNKWGRLTYIISPIVDEAKEIKIIVSDKRVNSKNKFQYFKTSNRKLYDDEYKKYLKKEYFDVIFLNESDEIAEGAITNIFVYKKKKFFTPPINSGILDGVYRNYLLKKMNNVTENKLYLIDLINADKIILTNSVRKEIVVNKLVVDDKIISF